MKIPDEIIFELENRLDGMTHGKAGIEISLHDSKPRYIIYAEQSIVLGKSSSGAQPSEDKLRRRQQMAPRLTERWRLNPGNSIRKANAHSNTTSP